MMETAEATAAAVVVAPPPLPESDRTKDQGVGRKASISRFIDALLKLARPDDEKHKDRAAIAALRGSLRDTPADFYRAAQYVVGFLGDRASNDDRWFYLVGGLFALHSQHREGSTFGQACRMLRDDSGSIDNRFLALLNTRAEALPRVLRQMVTLLEARGVALDYKLLLSHLCEWDALDNRVQKRWARDYFRDPKATSGAAADDRNTDDSNTTTDGDTDED